MAANPCPNCDPEVPGVRGLCLEHRAQAAEDMAIACERLLTAIERNGGPQLGPKGKDHGLVEFARAVLAKVRP